ncbi:DNA-J related domain-containing protein [Marinobacter sp.]|uniref:DNA-J related domain-containing protein n=1 Tax=Marinobacter sp. TaxID=50741 RepID=UPI0035636D4F
MTTTPHSPKQADVQQPHWLEQQIEHLLLAVEHELRAAGPLGLSELELIKALQSDRWGLIGPVNFHQSEQLYPVHFLIFHTLYRLNDQLLPEGESIHLSPIRIRLFAIDRDTNESLPGHTDELRSFYLDIGQYFMSNTEIRNMVDNFWKGTVRQKPDNTSVSSAAQRLGFECPPAQFITVKQQFRKLVMKAHPDRGGSTEEVQSLNESFSILKAYYS